MKSKYSLLVTISRVEYDDGQPIEYVVNGCSSECPPQLIFIDDLGEGHESVRHRSASVCTHNDWDCQVNGYD